MSTKQFVDLPPSESCRLIPFESADILESNPPVLVVSGQAPCFNMEVSLRPVVYVRCPEYWRIEVVGCLPGAICQRALKPYTVCIPLEGIIGSEGIEVAGADGSKQIQIGGGCGSREEIDRDRSVGG